MSGQTPSDRSPLRCAIYTRKSTEEGLEQEFNSLMAQREAAEAYILSQRELGWKVIPATPANVSAPSLRTSDAGRAGAIRAVVRHRTQPPVWLSPVARDAP